MEIDQIIKSGDFILTKAQAAVFIMSAIKGAVNKIKKASIVKNTIEDFNYDIYLSKSNNINIDENVVKDLVESCDKPIKINELKELLIEYFIESGEKSDDAQKLAEFFLTNYFNNINDYKDAALSKIISDIDDIKSSIKKMESKGSNIKTVEEIEEELRTNLREDAKIKDFDLRYFEIDDSNFIRKFNVFIDNGKEINISSYSREEGIYCILNYLKYNKNLNNIYIIDDEEKWNNLNEDRINNSILIANFYPANIFKKYKNAKHIFVYNNSNEYISGETVELRKRTIKDLIKILNEKYEMPYEDARKFVKDTNGNYYLVIDKLFTNYELLPTDENERKKLYLLFIINSFSSSAKYKEYMKDYFGIDYEDIYNNILSKDCYKKYFKKYDMGGEISIELLDSFTVWQKFELHKSNFVRDIIYKIMESIANDIRLSDNSIYLGFIKSLIIYNIFNIGTFSIRFDDFTSRIISLIKTKTDWYYAKNILDYLIELSPDIVLKRIINEFNGKNNSGLVEYFVNNSSDHLYINVLWMIEKSLYLAKEKKLCFEALFEICDKRIEYKMNKPKDILRKLVFPGINSPIDFKETEKYFDEFIVKYKSIDIWEIFYENVHGGIAYSWSKPKVYYCEEGYINDAVETWKYCFEKLRTLSKSYERIIAWIQLIVDIYHTLNEYKDEIINTINRLCNKGDTIKFYLKYNILQLIYNYDYFNKKGAWDIDDDSKTFLKNIVNDIKFDDEDYNLLLYFQNINHYNLITPIRFDDNNHSEENRIKAKDDKERFFNDNKKIDLEKVIAIYKLLILSLKDEFRQYDFQLGQDIAEYIDKKIFNRQTFEVLLNSFLAEDRFHKEIFDYIYSIDINCEIIMKIKEIYLEFGLVKNNFYIRLLYLIFRVTGNLQFIDDEKKEIQSEFWERFDEYILLNDNNYQVFDFALNNLKKYNNFSTYISIIDYNKEKLKVDETIKYISALNEVQDLDIKYSYELSDVLNHLFQNKFDEIKDDQEFLEQLSKVELNILENYHVKDYKFTQYLFEKYPESYAEFVMDNDEHLDANNSKKISKKIMRYNGFTYRLNLNKLSEIEFKEWISKFKKCLQTKISNEDIIDEIYYENIGSIIGMSNVDKDGAFPRAHYRQFIEENPNETLLNSIFINRYSRRGMYTPKQGEYNYSIVEFFEKCIEKCKGYNNTIIVLQRLRDSYLYDAEREREISENEEF